MTRGKNIRIKLPKPRFGLFSKSSWSSATRIAIGDSISSHKKGKSIFGKGSRLFRQEDNYQDKLGKGPFYFFYLVILATFLLLLGRLFILTVVQGQKFKDLAENNRIKLIEVEAKRGKIFDRHGVVLSQSEVNYLLKKNNQTTEITEDQAKELELQGLASQDFEGELGQIFFEMKRRYDFGEITAHVLGYTTLAQEEDLKEKPSISLAQSFGRLGIEETYDDFLRGQNGKKLVEVDSLGKNVSILGSVEAKNGRDVHLTIDSSLQKVAFETLKRHAEKIGSKRGAVVIEEPDSGEVLALASLPSFDGEDPGRFLNDRDKPFFNRAIQGTYPPGSIFKIVSALAGLESGIINKDTQIEDVGEFKIADDRFTNWYFLQAGKKDGFLKIDRAIARSNDIFFYRVAEKTGLEILRKMAIKFGFGQKTGIDLPNEGFGLVPSSQWKQSAQGADWFLGDTLHLGIGQGFMLATPIQINSLTSFMASGRLMRPYLVFRIDGTDGASSINAEKKIESEDLVKSENFDTVRQGMRQACEQGGTAFAFFDAPYKVGCKTGTAEKTLGNPHAWFTAFAPFDKPEVSVTVIIEDGGEGSRVAAPVAREILNWWFANR